MSPRNIFTQKYWQRFYGSCVLKALGGGELADMLRKWVVNEWQRYQAETMWRYGGIILCKMI